MTSRPATPILQIDNKHFSRSTTPSTVVNVEKQSPSKAITPVIDLEQPIANERDITLTDDQLDNRVNTSQTLTLTSIQLPSNIRAGRNKETQKQLEAVLVKQGKQLRALYELQKSTNEKVTWIQNQIKKQNNNKNIDLSPKVFSVSNFIF
jgi:hypothetical protein